MMVKLVLGMRAVMELYMIAENLLSRLFSPELKPSCSCQKLVVGKLVAEVFAECKLQVLVVVGTWAALVVHNLVVWVEEVLHNWV